MTQLRLVTALQNSVTAFHLRLAPSLPEKPLSLSSSDLSVTQVAMYRSLNKRRDNNFSKHFKAFNVGSHLSLAARCTNNQSKISSGRAVRLRLCYIERAHKLRLHKACFRVSQAARRMT